MKALRRWVALGGVVAFAALCGAGMSVAMTTKQNASGSDVLAAGRWAQADGVTEVIADDATNTVRVMIAGREVVVIDANGLSVRGNVRYNGKLSSEGELQAGDQLNAPCSDAGVCGNAGAGP